MAAATELTLAGAYLAGFAHFGDVGAGTDGFEELDGRFGFGDREAFRGDDEGDFGYGRNAVTAGLEKRRN